MMKKIKYYLPFLLSVFYYTAALAQNADKVEMADAMRANGKIYVVVVSLLLILIGLLIYLFATDRKITRLEKEIKEEQ